MRKQKNTRESKETVGIRVVHHISNLVDRIVVIILVLLCAYGAYGIWDTNQVLSSAQATTLQQYKPETEERLSFEELQKINSEVLAWLTVYGTKIDYPVTQGENDQKYVNTDVKGNYSLAGSIFLSSENASDFSDFNSIIYGHHMDKEAMFGGLDQFVEQAYFDQHQYGNLYYDGNDYGIEFFAFIKGDAYDWTLYNPAVQGAANQEAYLAYLLAQASCIRPLEVTSADRIVLLSTCASEPTNGRHILIGKLSDEPFADPFYEETKQTFLGIDLQSWWAKIRALPLWLKIVFLAIWPLLFVLLFLRRKKNREERKQSDEDSKTMDD